MEENLVEDEQHNEISTSHKNEDFGKSNFASENYSFDAGYISVHSKTVFYVTLEINNNEQKIQIISSSSKLTLFTIKQIDYISFVKEESIKPETVQKLKNEIFKKNTSLLKEKSICRITYIPRNTKQKCCCCCKSPYQERDVTTTFFLIDNPAVENIEKALYAFNCMNKISYSNESLNPHRRKILFFVNPVSGTGISLKIWARAKEIFEQTDLEITVIFTERVKHAYDVVLNLPIGEYDGIVNCSGDGIFHEIVNGVFHRQDREAFLERTCFGLLPAGSANAMSKAISDYCGEDNRLETCCYFISKGIVKKVDIQECELSCQEKKVYSFLTFTYGMVADIDLESEVIRCCGMVRTTIWGAIRWAFLRKYFGCLYYLPQDSKMDLDTIPSIKENIPDNDPNYIVENDNWNFFVAGNQKFIGETIKTVPLAVLDDGYHDIVALKASTSGRGLLARELITYIDDGDEFIDKNGKIREGIHYYKTKWWRLIPKKHLEDPNDVGVTYKFDQYFSIDGERYPICPVQVKTLNKVLKVFSGKP